MIKKHKVIVAVGLILMNGLLYYFFKFNLYWALGALIPILMVYSVMQYKSGVSWLLGLLYVIGAGYASFLAGKTCLLAFCLSFLCQLGMTFMLDSFFSQVKFLHRSKKTYDE